jgi:hypothetical protein
MFTQGVHYDILSDFIKTILSKQNQNSINKKSIGIFGVVAPTPMLI